MLPAYESSLNLTMPNQMRLCIGLPHRRLIEQVCRSGRPQQFEFKIAGTSFEQIQLFFGEIAEFSNEGNDEF